ncbi:MAG: excinuclease ABC subunit UvrB, partial [Phreatobacter sp.]|nr:excinuclease ABC subunit UvrB [Phreatobacter sp.]
MPKAPKSPAAKASAAKPARASQSRAPKAGAPKSKATRPELQPLGPALADLLNPAINRGTAGLGSGTGPSGGFAEAPQPALAGEATLADKALAHRLGIGVEQAQALDIESEIGASGVTATVKALERLIQEGRPEVNGQLWVPHKPPRPEKWEG